MSTMRTVFDLTVPLSAKTLRYPGDQPPVIERETEIEKGANLTVTHLSLNCHVGTHVDAPAHFLADGESLDELRFERFYGPAVVREFLDCDVVTRRMTEDVDFPERHHILFKTKNSELLQLDTFSSRHCTISPGLAEQLSALQPLSIGFDYYSLDPYSENGPFTAHLIFARAGIPVFVCLDLQGVPPGYYMFSGFPLRLVDAEASPVRAVLMKNVYESD